MITRRPQPLRPTGNGALVPPPTPGAYQQPPQGASAPPRPSPTFERNPRGLRQGPAPGAPQGPPASPMGGGSPFQRPQGVPQPSTPGAYQQPPQGAPTSMITPGAPGWRSPTHNLNTAQAAQAARMSPDAVGSWWQHAPGGYGMHAAPQQILNQSQVQPYVGVYAPAGPREAQAPVFSQPGPRQAGPGVTAMGPGQQQIQQPRSFEDVLRANGGGPFAKPAASSGEGASSGYRSAVSRSTDGRRQRDGAEANGSPTGSPWANDGDPIGTFDTEDGARGDDAGKEIYRDANNRDWISDGRGGWKGINVGHGADPYEAAGHTPGPSDDAGAYVGWDLDRPPRDGETHVNRDNGITWQFNGETGEWENQSRIRAAGGDTRSEAEKNEDAFRKRMEAQFASERTRIEGSRAEQMDPRLMEERLKTQGRVRSVASAKAMRMAMQTGARGDIDPATMAALQGGMVQNQEFTGAAQDAAAREGFENQNMAMRQQWALKRADDLSRLAQMAMGTETGIWAAQQAEIARRDEQDLRIQLAELGYANQPKGPSEGAQWAGAIASAIPFVGGLLGKGIYAADDALSDDPYRANGSYGNSYNLNGS